jgi:hypothetical protein
MIKESIKESLKLFFGSLLKYYPALAAILTVIFTLICLIFGEFYLSSFSINYFSFGGITDVYQIPLSNGVIETIFWLSIFITIGFQVVALNARKNILFSEGEELENNNLSEVFSIKDRVKFFALALFFILCLFGVLYFIKFILIDLPEIKAENIKNGFSERYNIQANDKEYLCHSIIGSNSHYLFVWNYEKNRPLIISRSGVKVLEQVVTSSPPLRNAKKKIDSREEYNTKKEGLKIKQREWSGLLKKNCSQSVVWREW